ncbi:MAG: chorismate mutase [Methylacidiphilales bacterium]|nr:chorismate mutase [Candidatus Methylacidiphilales bacterium]MDW8348939.1 chorismate mutase [Verrucomicrobiae bacterium]
MKTEEAESQLKKLREEIDVIDEQILLLLIKRLGIASHVGRIKSCLNYPIFDAERERELLRRLKGIAKEKVTDVQPSMEELTDALVDEMVEGVFSKILSLSRCVQEKKISEGAHR